MYNEVFLKFMSKKENISIIRNTISALLLEKNPTITFINELKTVISEITTNSIVHGYEADESKSIEIFVVLDDEKFSCIIKDFGKGIEDVDKAKEPLFSTKKEEERSGLGFTIMQLFCDELIVESILGKGTKLHLEKKW